MFSQFLSCSSMVSSQSTASSTLCSDHHPLSNYVNGYMSPVWQDPTCAHDLSRATLQMPHAIRKVESCWRAAALCTMRPECRRATCNWCTAPRSHHTDFAATALVARVTSPIQGRCPGLPVSIRQCTDLSGRRLSAHRWHQHDPLCSTDTVTASRAFAVAAPRIWNSLPASITASVNYCLASVSNRNSKLTCLPPSGPNSASDCFILMNYGAV